LFQLLPRTHHRKPNTFQVVSPFQAIVDYETQNDIPSGWINFAISQSKPNGFWHRLERGEIELNDDFFRGFSAELHNPGVWKDFHKRHRGGKKKLKDYANPSQLGDPISLKAETADSSPTSADKGANSSADPSFSSSPTPPLPRIDASTLFWNMMTISRTPDPYIHPYLLHLSSLSPRPFLLGALSNTITFPASHPFSAPYSTASTIRSLFDTFTASAEVGLRKPHREIYELALRELDRVSRKRGLGRLEAGDVLFLDDIGENLRMGREVGMRTLRVGLGEGRVAVRELEAVTGVSMERSGAKL